MSGFRGRIGDWWAEHAVRAIGVGMGAVVAAWLVGMYLLTGLNNTPSWWPRVDPEDPGTVERAEVLERAFTNQASMARDPTDEQGSLWQVAVTGESANAWLASRLRAWVENERVEWPEDVVAVRTAFTDDRVLLGAQIGHGSGRSVVWVGFTPEVREDGSVWVRTHNARVGRVSVPGEWALGGLQHEIDKRTPAGAEGAPLGDVLTGRVAVTTDPVVHLPDGRDVRIVGLRVRGGRVELSLRTISSR